MNVISINIKSLKEDVDFPNYFQKQVRARISKGDIDGAIAELEKKVPPEPNRSWWKYQWKYYWLGQLLVWRATLDKRSDRKADLDKAKADLDKALENFSKYRSVGPGQDQKVDGWPYYARAWERLGLGDPKGAIEDVEEADKVGKSKQLDPSLHDPCPPRRPWQGPCHAGKDQGSRGGIRGVIQWTAGRRCSS